MMGESESNENKMTGESKRDKMARRVEEIPGWRQVAVTLLSASFSLLQRTFLCPNWKKQQKTSISHLDPRCSLFNVNHVFIYLPCQFFCEENICQLWLAVSLKSEFCEKLSRKSRSQLEIHIVFVTRSRTKRFLVTKNRSVLKHLSTENKLFTSLWQ